jgi:hypothetical protein
MEDLEWADLEWEGMDWAAFRLGTTAHCPSQTRVTRHSAAVRVRASQGPDCQTRMSGGPGRYDCEDPSMFVPDWLDVLRDSDDEAGTGARLAR